jgi:hypothetical protein
MMKFRMKVPIRNLGRDEAINVVGITWLVLIFKPYQNVCMRKATLLKLNHVDLRNNFAHEALGTDVFDELIEMKLEDAGNEVRPIFRFLTWKEILCHLSPPSICSDSDEEGWSAKEAIDCHCVLEELAHVVVGPRKT